MSDFKVHLFRQFRTNIPIMAPGTYYFMVTGKSPTGSDLRLFSGPIKSTTKWTAAQLHGVPSLTDGKLYVSFDNYVYYVTNLSLPANGISTLPDFKTPSVPPLFVPVPWRPSPMVIRTYIGLVLFALALWYWL